MKKRFSVFFIILSFLMLFVSLTSPTKTKAYAETIKDNVLEISSKSAFLLDEKTGKIIYAKNEEERLPIASMCKIMTLLICFDNVKEGNLSLDEEILVSENASKMGGSQVFLENNATYKCSELIKSIIVASANDASVAMAERISGSESAFVNLMNEKCKELELNNTYFTNCTGLPKVGQYSCAKDVATMFRELIQHEEYFIFSNIWMDEIKHPNERVTSISNTNKLIKFYKGCDGGKTGYTSEAGHCLCATAKKDGTRLISVVIKATDSKTRFKDVSNMFNYGFNNFVTKTIFDNNQDIIVDFKLKNGKISSPKITVEKPVYYFTEKNSKTSFEYSYQIDKNIKAPATCGTIIGKITIFVDNIEYDTVNLVLKEDVLEKSYFDNVIDVIVNWNII